MCVGCYQAGSWVQAVEQYTRDPSIGSDGSPVSSLLSVCAVRCRQRRSKALIYLPYCTVQLQGISIGPYFFPSLFVCTLQHKYFTVGK